jgi:hypothetical protein
VVSSAKATKLLRVVEGSRFGYGPNPLKCLGMISGSLLVVCMEKCAPENCATMGQSSNWCGSLWRVKLPSLVREVSKAIIANRQANNGVVLGRGKLTRVNQYDSRHRGERPA